MWNPKTGLTILLNHKPNQVFWRYVTVLANIFLLANLWVINNWEEYS